MLGPVSGGAVRLGPATPRLAIAEGIEEALTVAQSCTELVVWSGLSTTHMAKLTVPAEVDDLIVCANKEEAGERAAHQLIKRFLATGTMRTAKLALPKGAADFNDLLRGAS